MCTSEELTLQDLEVLYIRVFGVDVELDAGHGHIVKNAIVDLAESSSERDDGCQCRAYRDYGPGDTASFLPSSALLDLGHV